MRNMAIIAVTAVLGLSACGDTMGEQALMGAGAGALAVGVAGGDPLLGAAGGAAGNVLYCRQNPGQCR